MEYAALHDGKPESLACVMCKGGNYIYIFLVGGQDTDGASDA